MLHEDASVCFRSQGHLSQFGGSLPLSKSLWNSCGCKVLCGKPGYTLQEHRSEAEKGLVPGTHILGNTLKRQTTDANPLAVAAMVGSFCSFRKDNCLETVENEA